MSSLWAEGLRPTVILSAGVLSLLIGRAAANRSPKSARIFSTFAALIAILAAADHYAPTRRYLGAALSSLGGEGIVAGVAMLFLVGVASAPGKRYVRRWLAVVGAAFAFLVLLVFSAAPLYWRWFGHTLHSNFPDADGKLQQTTGITCAPASAAMLLHQHGLRVSEGEVAEAAGSNPLIGTDEFALAAALERATHGSLRGRAAFLDYTAALRLRLPFVAYVRRPGVGGHAILVTSLEATTAHTVDPLTGAAESSTLGEFEAEWTGIAIWLGPER